MQTQEFSSTPIVLAQQLCTALNCANVRPDILIKAARELEAKAPANDVDFLDDLQGLLTFFRVEAADRPIVMERLLAHTPTPELPGVRIMNDAVWVDVKLFVDGVGHEASLDLNTGRLNGLPRTLLATREREEHRVSIGGVDLTAYSLPTMIHKAKTTAWILSTRSRETVQAKILQRHPFRFCVVRLDEEIGQNGSELDYGVEWLNDEYEARRSDAIASADRIFTHETSSRVVAVIDRGADDRNPLRTIVYQVK